MKRRHLPAHSAKNLRDTASIPNALYRLSGNEICAQIVVIGLFAASMLGLIGITLEGLITQPMIIFVKF